MKGSLERAVVLHGIANCDTVKRARAWFEARGLACRFHDVKRQGVPEQELEVWLAEVGWERLLNRQGTTWRKLEEARRSAVVDAASAAALMREHPSLIRRPVVRWPGGALTVGFDEATYSRLADA